MSIDHIRRDYTQRTLSRGDLQAEPLAQFQHWFDDTLASGCGTDPTAMVLATCANNQPRQRVVLLKGFDNTGFRFFTNYESEKGRQLLSNPHCSLHFAWLAQERQVHIEGYAEKLSTAENTAYFQSRPRASQVSAWASLQSKPVATRAELDAQYQAIEERFAGHEILPLPPHWGGFKVVPQHYEFWQGRSGRLHDRFAYHATADGWLLQRLQP